MKTGVQLIAEERTRQIEQEGWSASHDDTHGDRALGCAAEAYLKEWRTRWGAVDRRKPPSMWPWKRKDWKPTADPIRQLVKAGALIAAELDRLQRELERLKAHNQRAGGAQ